MSKTTALRAARSTCWRTEKVKPPPLAGARRAAFGREPASLAAAFLRNDGRRRFSARGSGDARRAGRDAIDEPDDLIARFQPGWTRAGGWRQQLRRQVVANVNDVGARLAVVGARECELLGIGRPEERIGETFTQRDALDALVEPIEIDGDLHGFRLLGSIREGRRTAFHLVERLFQLAIAGRLLVVLGPERDQADVGARIAGGAPAREGDHLAIGRPDRIALAVRMARDVEMLALAVGRDEPDVAVEILVLLGVDEPFAVGRPIVIGAAPVGEDELRLLRRQIEDAQIATATHEGEPLAVRAQLEVATKASRAIRN